MEGGDLSESVGVVQHWSLRSFCGHMKLKEIIPLPESLQTGYFVSLEVPKSTGTKKY